ncbi:hypothetical protein [Microbacterium laevaniformans]|uniref:hypothetical protein n=1 Tax=Microbacterium laevaniformans TaxID=36807 RepID=UPI001E2A4EE1|nr:hypothetical protein [Microbacterium laevaniformans]
MAHRLIRARERLAIWSRMPRPDLVELGASPVDTPGALAAHSDAVLVWASPPTSRHPHTPRPPCCPRCARSSTRSSLRVSATVTSRSHGD